MKVNKFKFLLVSSVVYVASSIATFATDTAEHDTPPQPNFRVCKQPHIPVQSFGSASGPRLSLIQTQASRWVNGTQLFYYFLENDGGNDTQRDAVRNAFTEWKDLGIGLSFTEVQDPAKAQIKIGFNESDGSWSYVGRDALTYAKNPGDKSMNFGWDLTTDYGHITALHEIGHALGFPHEHQSPFAGIVWNAPAVYAEFSGPPNNWDNDAIDHNIISKLPVASVRGSTWDPDSVMHYQFRAGLISVPQKYQTQDLIPPYKLSSKDVEFVRSFYPVLPDEYPVLEPFKSSVINVNPGEQLDFSIKPDEDRSYTVKTFGEMDAVMVLFKKDGNSFVKVQGIDNSGTDDSAVISEKLEKGQDYLLRLRLQYAAEKGAGSVMLY
jgi:hypothetical protein